MHAVCLYYTTVSYFTYFDELSLLELRAQPADSVTSSSEHTKSDQTMSTLQPVMTLPRASWEETLNSAKTYSFAANQHKCLCLYIKL